MKKIFLINLILVAYQAPAALAQQLEARHFYFLDGTYYAVKGALAGSALDFHAERGGGKRLLHLPVPETGSQVFKAVKGFHPEFVVNVNNEENQTPGSKKVAFFDQEDFSVKELKLEKNTQGIGISCKLEANNANSYRLYLWKKPAGAEEQLLDTSVVLLANPYSYLFVDDQGTAGAVYQLGIVALTDQQEIIRSAPLATGKVLMPEVYPNPSSDFLKLRGLENLSEWKSYSIYSLNGHAIILNGNLSELQDKGVRISELSSGSYLIKIDKRSGLSYSIPFQKL